MTRSPPLPALNSVSPLDAKSSVLFSHLWIAYFSRRVGEVRDNTIQIVHSAVRKLFFGGGGEWGGRVKEGLQERKTTGKSYRSIFFVWAMPIPSTRR